MLPNQMWKVIDTSPPLTCHCCLTSFKKTMQPNKQLLNGHPFCHRCREQYRKAWYRIISENTEKIKNIFENNRDYCKNLLENTGYNPEIYSKLKDKEIFSYSSVIINYIESNDAIRSLCKRLGRVNLQNQGPAQCSLDQSLKSKTCVWCIFNVMMPMVEKMTFFRSPTWSLDSEYFKTFYGYNLEISKEIILSFNEKAKRTSLSNSPSMGCSNVVELNQLRNELFLKVEAINKVKERESVTSLILQGQYGTLPAFTSSSVNSTVINRSVAKRRCQDLDQFDSVIEQKTPRKITITAKNQNFSINNLFSPMLNIFKQINDDDRNSCEYLKAIFTNSRSVDSDDKGGCDSRLVLPHLFSIS